MKKKLNAEIPQKELPPEVLNSLARFLSREIREFYRSDRGKTFYANWLKEHPEYDPQKELPG